MVTSRITTGARTTIPLEVRVALDLAVGDTLAYAIDDGHVILSKTEAVSISDPFATFGEWGGDADRRAYADL
jgi:antitoxin PrlF